MRVSRTTPRDETGPFNALFDPLAGIVDAVFQERLPIDAPGIDLATYVHVPETENSLVNFAMSQSGDIALLVGVKGIGKSSVVQYVRDNIWKSPGQPCKVLFRDLSNESFATQLGDDYRNLPLREKRARASLVASRITDALIQKELFEDGFYQREVLSKPAAVRSFVETFCAGDAPPEALDFGCTDQEFMNGLRRIDTSNFLRIILCYLLRTQNVPHLKVVFDNTDDKDGLLICSLTEKLAHLHKWVETFSRQERSLDKSAPVRRVSPFITCRPPTRDLIHRVQIEREGGGWYGFRTFHITRPVSLYSVITRRYDIFMKLLRTMEQLPPGLQQQLRKLADRPVPKDINLPIGERDWNLTFPNYDALYHRIFRLFDATSQADELLQICNYNIAEALSATYSVLRNKHFIDVDSLFAEAKAASSGDTIHSDERHRRLFSTTTILKSLAYGNQGDVNSSWVQYPINRTRIPNVLHSESAPVNVTLFKLRLLSLFSQKVMAQTHSLDSATITIADILRYGEKWFRLNDDTKRRNDAAINVVDEMFAEELLANHRSAHKPSESDPECELMMTPRAWILWNHLQDDSVLLECYRDAIELDEMVTWENKPVNWRYEATRALEVNERALQVFWVILEVWRTEVAELGMIVDRGQFVEFTALFGDYSLAGMLLQGLEGSVMKYYRNQHGWRGHNGIMEKVQRLKEEIRMTWNLWRQRVSAS